MSFVDHSATATQRSGFGGRDFGRTDGASDDVMMILEAANDLGDHDTVAVCHRIIEASRIGAPVSPADMQVVLTYFR
jgi:hypothetical protein